MSAMPDIVKALTARPQRTVARHDADLPASRTQALLQLLESCGPMTTSELRAAAALAHTRLVWGLLKGPRASGQVQHDAGLWSIDHTFPGTDVLRAAELLRGRGWFVQAPSA